MKMLAFAGPGHRVAGPLALALVLALPATARPQTASDRTATAQGLYETAAELMKAGRFALACPKLEESQRLDPALSTQFFLAACYESTGRPTRAWSLFLEVAGAARTSGNTLREGTARARAAALEPRLPRLAVAIAWPAEALPGLEVTRDGAALKPVVWGSAIPVDLGEHTVGATAPGKAPWQTTVTVQKLGQKIVVSVPPLHDAEAPALAAAPAGALPRQRVAALVTGGAGVASLVVGGILGGLARSASNQADAACPTHLGCSQDARDQSTRSVSLTAGSTTALVIGGAAVGGGLLLWFLPPRRSSAARLQVVPIAGAGAAGGFVSGAF